MAGFRCWLVFSAVCWVSVATAQNTTPVESMETIKVPTFIDVAHRGASGYLPEHSRASTVLAHGLGADYIEQDVQLSRDGIPVVLHDLYLDRVSNVAELFPKRHRADGHYYVVDFSLSELRQLTLQPRTNSDGELRYPKRFQPSSLAFPIQTLAETISLIKQLNRTREQNTGVYIEIKAPRWYHDQGYDATEAVIQVLQQQGYQDDETPTKIYLQSFNPETLRRLKREFHIDYPLVQLIADNSWNESAVDYDSLRTYAGMESLSAYADSVGLWLNHLLVGVENGQPHWADALKHAHRTNLQVFVYTLRDDQLPDGVSSLKELRDWLKKAGVAGAFSDFPDKK
ncbi:MAG: glycerophosphodiester phosphodiesterase [Pseudomonadota bacterium]